MKWKTVGSYVDSQRKQDLFVCSETSSPGLWITQPSVQWVPGFFHGSKAVGGEVGQIPPSSSEVKNEWSYTYTPSYIFPVSHSDNLSFTVPCLSFLPLDFTSSNPHFFVSFFLSFLVFLIATFNSR
jgi:hypothetical protein